MQIDSLPFLDPSAQVNVTKTGNGSQPDTYLFTQEKIPTICLPDPIGIATRIQADLLAMQRELQSVVEAVHADPLFGCALMTYQLFFNPRVAMSEDGVSDAQATAYMNSMGGLMEQGLPYSQVTQDSVTEANVFKQNQANLDLNKLQKLLAVNQRTTLRALITLLQTTLITRLTQN